MLAVGAWEFFKVKPLYDGMCMLPAGGEIISMSGVHLDGPRLTVTTDKLLLVLSDHCAFTPHKAE